MTCIVGSAGNKLFHPYQVENSSNNYKKLNINKTDKEIFIDILTCGDTAILKAVGMFISAAYIT